MEHKVTWMGPYPMPFQMDWKEKTMDIAHTEPINAGDVILNPGYGIGSVKVEKVLESRPARGDHGDNFATWNRIKFAVLGNK